MTRLSEKREHQPLKWETIASKKRQVVQSITPCSVKLRVICDTLVLQTLSTSSRTTHTLVLLLEISEVTSTVVPNLLYIRPIVILQLLLRSSQKEVTSLINIAKIRSAETIIYQLCWKTGYLRRPMCSIAFSSKHQWRFKLSKISRI